MDANSTSSLPHTHKLDTFEQISGVNRICLNHPETVYDALHKLEGEIKYFSLCKTTLLRTVVPALGGPKALPDEHVSPLALEFLRSIPIESLANASQLQENYFAHAEIKASDQRRHRCYLKHLIKEMQSRGWILVPVDEEEDKPCFNRINSPQGQRRSYAQDLRTTTLKHPKTYALDKFEKYYVEVEDEAVGKRKVLANPTLEAQLFTVKQYVQKVRKGRADRCCTDWLMRILYFLHEVEGIPLHELTLNRLIPSIKLKVVEDDFKNHEDFSKTETGEFQDPEKVEQKLAMAEALARRRLKKAAEVTLGVLERFFAWREQELALCGKPEGFENSSKRAVIGAVILGAEAAYEHETAYRKPKRIQGRRQQRLGFDDIDIITQLRTKHSDYPIDNAKVNKRINDTRCVPWLQAIEVFEKQRSLALTYFIDSRDHHRKSGSVRRRRKLSGTAKEMQKSTALGLMLFIPADRQETYCNLQFGVSFKNGRFLDADFEQFEDWGVPSSPDEAHFWINLEDFKTVDTYGEFWYPVPNVQFTDGTTFYEMICAWLWGFEDHKGHWPVCYKNEDQLWQGYIDPDGNRLGWRAALEPQHDYMFTMPNAKTPYYDNTFCAFMRSLFVRFTQEGQAPVPVTPHSLRHMFSNYLDSLRISADEEESFSYVFHHSPKIHQGRYVYRDNMNKIAPAVKRMNQILGQIML